MRYVVLALYALSYTSGIANVTLSALLWSRTREPAVLAYLALLGAFTANVLIGNLALFAHEFLGVAHPEQAFGFIVADLVVGAAFNVAGAHFIHGLSTRPFRGTYRTVFLTLCLLPLVVLCWLIVRLSVGADISTDLAWGRWGLTQLTTAFVAYSSVLFWRNRHHARNRVFALLMRLVLVLNAVWVPYMVVRAFLVPPGPATAPSAFSLGNVYYFLGNLISAVIVARLYFWGPTEPLGPPLATPEEPRREAALVRPVTADLSRWGLSEREQEIVVLLNQGLVNKEIAARLSIETSTVKNHVYRIYQKVGVSTRVALLHTIHAPGDPS